MKKCTFCGKEAPDEATVCAIDGEPVIDPTAPEPAPAEIKPIAGPAPLFGLLSVATSFLGALLIFVLVRFFAATGIGFWLAFVLVPFSPLFGVVLALGARKRSEQYGALPWIGLLINLAALCFLILNAKRMIFSMNWGG